VQLAVQVAETAPEAVAEDKDSINGVQQLSHEATTINQAFSQQVHALTRRPVATDDYLCCRFETDRPD
jgi:Eukaryotic translation initiation factor 3 subunit 7 (eIF-3)